MEIISAKKPRIFRTEEDIVKLLDECKNSNVTVKEFCARKGISAGSFHNWKSKYSGSQTKLDVRRGFTTLQVNAAAGNDDRGLFAEVNGIKIYQPVTAIYLKELLS